MEDEKEKQNDDEFKYKPGSIVGAIIEKRSMSIKQAKSYALELADCIGFSCLTAKKPDNELTVHRMHFKKGDGFVSDTDHWHTYLCPKDTSDYVDETQKEHIQFEIKILKQKDITIKDAELYALSLPNCIGFTYKSNELTTQKMVLFKCFETTVNKTDNKWESLIFSDTKNKVTLEMPKSILSHCLVISICIEEYGNTGAYDRVGCDVDAKNINNIFGKNGYQYTTIQNDRKHFNLTDYRKWIKDIKTEIVMNGNKYDALLCFISAHGKYDINNNNNSYFYLSDGNKITISNFIDNFRNECLKGIGNKFIGKPKMFFIEACCGYEELNALTSKEYDNVVPMDFDYRASLSTGVYGSYLYDNYVQMKDEKDDNCSTNVHWDEDIILLQSSTIGYQSYMNTQTGSYLITETIKALSKHNKIISFDDVIKEIKYNLKSKDVDQIAVLTTSSCMDIYFNAINKVFLHVIGNVDDVISPGPSDLHAHFMQQMYSFSNEEAILRRMTIETENK